MLRWSTDQRPSALFLRRRPSRESSKWRRAGRGSWCSRPWPRRAPIVDFLSPSPTHGARDLVALARGRAGDQTPRLRGGLSSGRGKHPGLHHPGLSGSSSPSVTRRGSSPDHGAHRPSGGRRRHHRRRSPRKADLIIFGWGGPPTASQVVRCPGQAAPRPASAWRRDPRPTAKDHATIDAVVRELPCDIAVVKQPAAWVRSILVRAVRHPVPPSGWRTTSAVRCAQVERTAAEGDRRWRGRARALANG